ncbi:basic amino acid ABC transporter substrate-binding protein [Cohnella luojiensis]|uniref:Basic amino acid ABC transporter substrate-binding protein n=1 Tax=Cohnella luojiensis TaxID=652876 RepID=A0A4Y8LRB6_9BACL|nr:basic amino acid ABC transporter substrate-binding protein [Cohnella luojiensis]TFE23367.1 basic amino acid ABC transporter substrate-binding protein [Cohnella luojiensis]
MKKTWIIALIASLVLVLSACGSKEEDGAGKKVYRFATDASYPPMENMDKDEIVGFDIDFLAAVMEEAGLEYEVKNIGWEALLEGVRTGAEFDGAISAITINDERLQSYDFSPPYFESTNMILVPEGSDIKSALDLKDKKVAVQGGTTADELMTGIMGDGNSSLKKFESNALALQEMASNGVDAVVADSAVVKDYIKNNPDKKFASILDTENFAPEYYGIAFPKDKELKALLEPAVKKVLESDKYKEMYEKWIGVEPDMTRLIETK